MNLLERIHERHVSQRRVARLAAALARHIPRGASVLEVGAGSGELLARIRRERPDLDLCGIDVLVREGTSVPVEAFDGRRVPRADRSIDVVLYADVLHHTEDPFAALAEGARVARRLVVIKDHLLEGLAAGATLRFMDRVGNARFGVGTPFNYKTRAEWLAAFERLGLEVEAFEPRLGLYPWPASWLFERSLHFVARLGVRSATIPP